MNLSKRELCSRPLAAILSLLIVCAAVVPGSLVSTITRASAQTASTRPNLTFADQQFLEDLERRSFQYFWAEANAQTGLVPDRARMDGSPLDENHRDVASIAATGFSLTALCVAAERNWVTHD